MFSRRSGGRRSPVSVRRTLVVLAALIGLLVQYFARTVLSGFGVPWVEERFPFVVLDHLLSAINAPVYWLLGLVYDPWAPDAIAILALLSWYAVLAVLTSALLAGLGRLLGPEPP